MESGEHERAEILYPALAAEILEMETRDQVARNPNAEDIAQMEEVDNVNTERMKAIVKEIGWPTVSKVGAEASSAAWLLAQHADHDVAFQKICLELITKESEGEVPERDLAYLYDRVCVNEGRPQLYGTQFTTNMYGAYGPQPIEDIEHVDERRALVGLEPLHEYKEALMKKYKIKN